MRSTANAANSVGIIEAGPEVVAKSRLNACTVGLPFAGTLVAIGFADFTLATFAVFLLFFFAGAVGIGIGLHRYFSHHAFRTSPTLRFVLGVLASWAWQGPVSNWVADHRRHHRFADGPLDPHSPHWLDGEPTPTTLRGLIHAHVGWMLTPDVSDPRRYAADVQHDRISSWCSRYYWPLAGSTLLLPAGLGYAIGGGAEAWNCLMWAGFARVALLQNVTWAIASLGHRFGDKLPESKDEARNSVVLAVLLFGEGLHSFHHVHPGVGVNEPSHLDFNGWILTRLERLGWIWNLKRVA